MIIKPFSDDYMRYDEKQHRYVLTHKGVLENAGIELARIFENNRDDEPTSQIDRFLEFISRHLYNYIYSHGNTQNRNVVEYALAKDKGARSMIEQCLLNEVEYALSDGAFWNKSGVNISKGSAMDLAALRDSRQVSADTESLLWQQIDVLKNTVLYKGIIRVPFGMEWRTDY